MRPATGDRPTPIPPLQDYDPAAAYGRGVVVGFVVDEADEVHRAKVTRSLGHGCDEEALRVASGLPTFQNSAAVPVQPTWVFSLCAPESSG